MGARMRFKFAFAGLIVAIGVAGAAAAAQAGELSGSVFSIDCQNGAVYKLTSGPVLAPGDIVTGHLHLSPRHATPVRLIPMGQGYRYAGRGIWLDGIRENALLYRSKYNPVACVVTRV